MDDNELASTTPVDIHRCRRGRDCPDNEQIQLPGTTATVRVGAQIAAQDGLCRCCERTTTQAVRELRADFTELHTLLAATPQAWPDGDRISGTRERQLPIRPFIAAVMTTLLDEVSFWAAVVASAGQTRAWVRALASSEHPETRMMRATAVLTRWEPWWERPGVAGQWFAQPVWTPEGAPELDEQGYWVMASVDPLSGALGLLRLHERVKTIAGRDPLVNRKPIGCPQCQTPTLVQADGSDTVSCLRCDRRMPEADYHRYVLALAQGLAS